MSPSIRKGLFSSLCALVTQVALANPTSADFVNPPNSYLPKTWMHIMCGNLSKEGFTKDFEAMADAGIGGALVFHIDYGIPCGPTPFGSDEFNQILAHAAVEADRVGIEMGLHNCDGWSSSGGPWVTPAQSMKKIVYTEQVVAGGAQTLALSRPPHSHDFYRDIALLAWPANQEVQHLAQQTAITMASNANGAIADLALDELDKPFRVAPDDQGKHWVQSSYTTPVTIKSIVTQQQSRHGQATLFTSDDGVNFNEVGPLPRFRVNKKDWSFEQNYPEGLTAKHFRLEFDQGFPLVRYELAAYSRMSDWQAKTGMVKANTPIDLSFPQSAIVAAKDIKVLHRGPLKEALTVNLPDGNWLVTRYGYTTTGAYNHPASDAGRGLEIDKLDGAALDHHFEQYVGKVVKEAKAKGSKALLYSEIDSFEMGGNNWSAGLDQRFAQKWEYDFIPWLPTTSGHVVESIEDSHGVLTDFRELVSDLMTQNYFQRFTDLLHEHDMQSYIEPYGLGTLNELEVGGAADRTMGEFWVKGDEFKGIFDAAVSSARIYGKKVISAESFTAWSAINWRGHPYSMKIYGDHAWASGINETMFHRYAHQPNTHVMPGMTMGSVGSHIDRTQTWWPNAGKAWFKYLARGSYLLQQGNPVSDFLIFTGDNHPNRLVSRKVINLPAGVNGDFVNTDVLMNRLSVQNGQLVLPEGTRYNALYLHNSQRLRLSTLKRIEQLVRAGALIVGHKPTAPIGYTGQQRDVHAFSEMANAVWGDKGSRKAYFKGQVINSQDAQQALNALALGPDLKIDGQGAQYFTHRSFAPSASDSDDKSAEQGELYFLFNQSKTYKTMNLDFRVSGLQPEIWFAESGKIEAIRDFSDDGKRTKMTLTVEPHGSRFVYFKPTPNPVKDTVARVLPPSNSPALEQQQLLSILGHSAQPNSQPVDSLVLEQPWRVEFDKAWGGPGTVEMKQLQDWIEHSHSGIRYYSGTANYQTQLVLDSSWAGGNTPVVMDLGQVNIAAQVSINGKALPVLWKPPYAMDVSQYLEVGRNQIDIAVTNVWTNRLIGDEAFPRSDSYDRKQPMPAWFSANQPPPASQRYTWTSYNFYQHKNKQVLEPSGLLGPVRLIKQQ